MKDVKEIKDKLKELMNIVYSANPEYLLAKEDLINSYKILIEYDLDDDFVLLSEVFYNVNNAIDWAVDSFINSKMIDNYTDLYEVIIIPGVGGNDTEDLSDMFFLLYSRYVQKLCNLITIDQKKRSFMFTSNNVYRHLFLTENCMYKVIRISPYCDKRQTSFIQICIKPINNIKNIIINPEDIEYETTKSSGAGGQHVNKTESAVRATHLPTKLSVFISEHRSQHQNKKLAFEILNKKVNNQIEEEKEKKKKKEYKDNYKIAWGNSYTRIFNMHKQSYLKNRLNLIVYSNIKEIIDIKLSVVIRDEILHWIKICADDNK